MVYITGEDMQADAKRVLLPVQTGSGRNKEATTLEAFIYKDSQDRLVQQQKEPKASGRPDKQF